MVAVLAERDGPIPAVPPYELTDDGGETIAEAELGWPELRLAVLDEAQMPYADRFEKRGWKVFALAPLLADPQPLLAARTHGDDE